MLAIINYYIHEINLQECPSRADPMGGFGNNDIIVTHPVSFFYVVFI